MGKKRKREDLPKYHKDREFMDPVVRCDSCSKIIRTTTLAELGMCKCGNRRVRNLMTFDQGEYKQMQRWDIDPDFLAQFTARQVSE